MSNISEDVQFTWADMEEWVEEGLIAPDQALAIRERVGRGGTSVVQISTRPAKGLAQALDMTTVAYYFGGFMILLAYTFFIGLRWQSLGSVGQLLVSVFTAGLLWGIGALLRRGGFSMAGNILIFAGTGIVPLIAYTLAQTFGWWPQTPDYGDPNYNDFHQTIRPYWVYLEAVSLAAAGIILWLVRFPLITLLMAFWGWYLSMDLARWVAGSDLGYGDTEQLVSLIVGAWMLIIGFVLQRRTREDYSRWLYLFGHVVVLGNLAALTYRKEGILGLVFIAVYVGFVVASVRLQRPVFLVFGALGCYGYISYLSWKTFSDVMGFPIVLAIVGLVIVLTTVGYQKYGRAWLEERVGRRALPSQRTA